ncbi:MAG: flagellar hook-basal body protein [Ruminococcaceae bacterium]|nr:flagellar hook-basal body protein [Oscillospiraceae bacterium]
MLAGYYTIASGMLTNQRQIDVIGNNLVNFETPGYKAERLLTDTFEEELLRRQEGYNSAVLGDGTGSVINYTTDTETIFTMGNIKATDRTGDVAIGGAGFFNIQSPTGQNYLTRNGAFTIDSEGYLQLQGYGRVQGMNGPINVGNNFDYNVTPDGQVTASDGTALGKFLITVPLENSTMERLDNGMFQVTAGGVQSADGNYSLVDKSLESSNIDMNEEMTALIQAQRAFQSCSSALQIIDNMNTKAATKIAAV